MYDKILICSECGKEFLYFGDPGDDEVFCSPECIENSQKKSLQAGNKMNQ